MSKTNLQPFTQELKKTWILFQQQWQTTVLLALTPAIPLAFLIPYFIKYLTASQTTSAPRIPFNTIEIIAIITLIIITQIVKASLFITFARGGKLTLRQAFKEGANRFFPFIYTNILFLIVVITLLIPAALMNSWYINTIRSTLEMDTTAIDLFVIIVLLLLALPAIFLAICMAFAPIMVAIRESKGGLTALAASYNLVRKQFKAVTIRLIGWSALYIIIARIASPLPIASWLTPFILTIMGAAFTIVVYKELK